MLTAILFLGCLLGLWITGPSILIVDIPLTIFVLLVSYYDIRKHFVEAKK